MRARLPPLTALKAFEATARHLSVTKAAKELFVTQGAVSRQIRVLEDHLHVSLFVRLTRRLDLTPEGQDYYEALAPVFDEIGAATERLRGLKARRVLKISVLPTISSFWLMPRLAHYSQAAGGAEVRIIASVEPVDFHASDIDLAIRVGRMPGERYAQEQPRIEMTMVTDWHGIKSDPLFPDILTPVCSRAFADAQGAAAFSIEALANVPKIHVTTRRFAWPDWLRARGIKPLSERRDLHFGHFFMALEAARAGQGVAIVPTILLRHYEGARDLACPFPSSMQSAGMYRLLFNEGREQDPTIATFRRWLLEQARSEGERAACDA